MSEHEVSETRKVKIYVAPCIKCKGDDVVLYHGNESSFNYGGGECKKCKNQVTADVDIFPTKRELAAIWNKANDAKMLVQAAEKTLEQLMAEKAKLESRIKELQSKTK